MWLQQPGLLPSLERQRIAGTHFAVLMGPQPYVIVIVHLVTRCGCCQRSTARGPEISPDRATHESDTVKGYRFVFQKKQLPLSFSRRSPFTWPFQVPFCLTIYTLQGLDHIPTH